MRDDGDAGPNPAAHPVVGAMTETRMRLGAILAPTDPWEQTVADARRLEQLGFDHLWVYDHLSWRRYHDRAWHATYPWLAGLAMATSTVRLGTMVANLNIRHPLPLAKDAMTIDHISSGRFVLGLGAGGLGYDATVLGQPPLTPGQRTDRLAEATRLIDGLLRGQTHDHSGAYYEVVDARVLPGCVQHPRVPIAVAAGAPRSMGIAAEYGDAWITYGAAGNWNPFPDDIALTAEEQVRIVDEHCDRLGRDPATLDRIFMIDNGLERPLASLEAFVDVVGRYAEMGFTDVVFHHPRPDDPVWCDDATVVEQIAEELLSPTLAGGPRP